jgi:beta-glucosidase-like glycosyl hydrolase
MPPDPRVRSRRSSGGGRKWIPSHRIDESVGRILAAKERLGLAIDRSVDRARMRRNVGRPEDAARAEEIAARSPVRNERAILPLRVEPLRASPRLRQRWINANVGAGGGIVAQNRGAGIEVVTRRIGPSFLHPARMQSS